MSDSHCLGLSMDNKTLRVSSNKAATSESASDAAGLSKIRSEQLKVVATLSHELRTPLHAIMGLSELLQSEEMSYTARRHIEKINSASQGLLDSLNKAIEAARSESGDLVINPVPSNLLNIVEETAKTYSIAIEGKGLELGLLLDPNLYGREVEVDRVHLQQILNNLLGNAIKFTDTGSIHLWVALKRDHGDRLDVVFSVEDTGIGIPENKISEILSPFGQVVDAQKGRPLGSGLGLAICNDLVRKMGGALAIQSTPASGTRVGFTLSLDTVQTHAQPFRFLSEPYIGVVAQKSVKYELIENFIRNWGGNIVRVEHLNELDGIGLDALIVTESVILDHKRASDDWSIKLPPGRMLVLREENSSRPPNMIERAVEMFEPILPSVLANRFDLCGLSNKVKKEIETHQKCAKSEQHLKVLAVDDSVTNLVLLKSQLQKMGVSEVILAKNGDDALKQMQLHGDIDLIFMDFNMPILDGPSATRQLREQGVSIPIIGLTALDMASSEVIDSEHLFDSILTKPVGMSEIEETVTHYAPSTYSSES